VRGAVLSLRRHRYENAHIERSLRGFYPVLIHPVALPKGLGGKGSGEKVPGFSILVEKKDGLRYRRSYAFFGNLVRLSGEERVEAPPDHTTPNANLNQPAQPETAPSTSESLYTRTTMTF